MKLLDRANLFCLLTSARLDVSTAGLQAASSRAAVASECHILTYPTTCGRTVESLVRRAAAVVLQPEVSPGTLWELTIIGALVDRKRLLLLVPNPVVRPLGFARVRMLIEETQQVALPPPGECPPCDAFMRLTPKQIRKSKPAEHQAGASHSIMVAAVGLEPTTYGL